MDQTSFPVPENEPARLRALMQCNVLDTGSEPVFDAFVAAAAKLCAAPVALVSLLDEQRQWFKASVGVDVSQTHRRLSFCGHTILSHEPMVVEDARLDPRFRDNDLVTGPPFVRFYAGVPLELSTGERLGSLCVIDLVPRTLTPEQHEGLKVLAMQATGMLELRRKLWQLEELGQQQVRIIVELRSSQTATEAAKVTIFSLARLAEARDNETGAHLERVRTYSRLLCEHLSRTPKFAGVVDAEFVELIYQTSPLHDIGKVAIPDFILLKPGRLTEREFRIMENHARAGAETLDAAIEQYPHAEFLRMARDIALTHHEKFDGSGYPNGLVGRGDPRRRAGRGGGGRVRRADEQAGLQGRVQPPDRPRHHREGQRQALRPRRGRGVPGVRGGVRGGVRRPRADDAARGVRRRGLRLRVRRAAWADHSRLAMTGGPDYAPGSGRGVARPPPRRTRSGCRQMLFRHRRTGRALAAVALLAGPPVALSTGCASIRTTDTARTATEQFLVSTAAIDAVDQLALGPLAGYNLFVDTSSLLSPDFEYGGSEDKLFLIGEIRNKLLVQGARLTDDKATADIYVEVRSGALGVDRTETLLGIPSLPVYASPGNNSTQVPVGIPELSIYKNLRQRGFASVAVVARWADTGELVTSTGPATGQTQRRDYWFFGIGPTTRGDIPPAQQTGE